MADTYKRGQVELIQTIPFVGKPPEYRWGIVLEHVGHLKYVSKSWCPDNVWSVLVGSVKVPCIIAVENTSALRATLWTAVCSGDDECECFEGE